MTGARTASASARSSALRARSRAILAFLGVPAAPLLAIWVAAISILVRRLRLPDRAAHLLAGSLLMLPIGLFSGAEWANVAGALMAVLLLAWERIQKRMSSSATTKASAK